MRHLVIRYSIYLFTGFSAIFLVAYLFGIAEHHWLRALNGLVHITMLYWLVKQYRQAHPESVNNYLSGTSIGLIASTIGVSAFAAFVYVFLKLDRGFFNEIQAQVPMPEFFTPLSAIAQIGAEGVAVGLIVSYIMVRVVDSRYDHTPSEGKVSKSMPTVTD